MDALRPLRLSVRQPTGRDADSITSTLDAGAPFPCSSHAHAESRGASPATAGRRRGIVEGRSVRRSRRLPCDRRAVETDNRELSLFTDTAFDPLYSWE